MIAGLVPAVLVVTEPGKSKKKFHSPNLVHIVSEPACCRQKKQPDKLKVKSSLLQPVVTFVLVVCSNL